MYKPYRQVFMKMPLYMRSRVLLSTHFNTGAGTLSSYFLRSEHSLRSRVDVLVNRFISAGATIPRGHCPESFEGHGRPPGARRPAEAGAGYRRARRRRKSPFASGPVADAGADLAQLRSCIRPVTVEKPLRKLCVLRSHPRHAKEGQCGLKVLPVSIRVLRRERMRGQPSAVEA